MFIIHDTLPETGHGTRRVDTADRVREESFCGGFQEGGKGKGEEVVPLKFILVGTAWRWFHYFDLDF